MKNKLTIVLLAVMIISLFSGCKGSGKIQIDGFNGKNNINVISREDGSGTRGAFTEIFDIIETDTGLHNADITTETSAITQSTGVMISAVKDNPYAIGYISLCSLNDSVKTVKIDGVIAKLENIKDDTYKASRALNIVTMKNKSKATLDFINFIVSEEGYKVITETGFVPKEDIGGFTTSKPQGKITIAGSSAITPVMEKLKESYQRINPNVIIEINQSDSTSGINAVAEGICDIGMSSRKLRDSEKQKGIIPKVIALDAITVIVSNENPISQLSSQQVKDIYTGKLTRWSEVLYTNLT